MRSRVIIISIIGILLLCGCPRPSGVGEDDTERREFNPDWMLYQEEKIPPRNRPGITAPRPASQAQLPTKPSPQAGCQRENTPETDSGEMDELKYLIDGIREECQSYIKNYLNMIDNISSYSDREVHIQDEEQAKTVGRNDVCRQVLDRIYERAYSIESEREIGKLEELIEGIRVDCQYSVDNYMEMLEKLSFHSSQEFFYQDEERAKILGKNDVCSQILARIEAQKN